MAATESLLCLVSKAHWDDADEARSSALVRDETFSWPLFWELAAFNSVVPMAVGRLEARSVRVPLAAKKAVETIASQNAKRREWTLHLLRVLEKAGIDVYLLKGFLLGELVYQNPSYKRMNDVDILLKPALVKEAVALLLNNGFRFSNSSLLGAETIDFRLHHAPPLVSADNTTLIGLHWGLTSPYAKRGPRGDIFEGDQTVVIDGVKASALSFENNLLHLCIHLPFFKIGLRELADVSNLVLHAGDALDVDLFYQRAKAWHCEDAVYRVLTLANRVIPFAMKIRSLKKRTLYVSDTHKREQLEVLLRSRSVYVGQIEKSFVLFKMAKSYADRRRHLFKQWQLFFRVPKEEQARLLAVTPENLSRFSGIAASGRLFFALAQNLGPFFLTVISVKNALSLLKQRFFDKNTGDALRTDLADAETLMGSIE